MHELPQSRFRTRGLAGLGLALAVVMTTRCAPPPPPPPAEPTPPALQALQSKIARFAPVEIRADVGALPPNEQEALRHIIEAARLMDGLFLEQVWAGNTSLLTRLAGDRTPVGQAALHYFLINKGPWSRIDHNEPFVPEGVSVPAKPAQANFYPADSTRDEVDKWFRSLGGATRALATGFFSVIRRGADGRLMAVPYHVQYRNTLVAAAEHLRQASALTSQPTLKRYLDLRAGAFLSNDYYDSDIAWMELDASIEPTIGPYETYEDEWFGYKAAFEAFVTLRDDAETAKLTSFSQELQALEDALPIDARYRNPKLGALAPIRVVNVVFTAGDGNRGVQTAAFNLPNDDRVISERGSKRVMLKNVQEAKFEKVLEPIAKVALSPADQANVSFDAFFTHILMHELMHGLGPQQVHGTNESVRQALKETNSALEEAKADISGLWALQQLADRGAVSADIARTMYTTFLASMFRSIRFGVNEAHGKGIAVQLNYMLDKGAIVAREDGTFAIVPDKVQGAVADLTRDIMTIQAKGDYEAARTLLSTMGVVRPEVQRVLDRLTDVPVDIEPQFSSAR
ncbi:MAG: hypothetical protein R2752_00210 [Vicinamibacterales bacterium]